MIRFAMMGCGRIAKRHCDTLKQNQVDGAKLVAVCDPVADRKNKFSSGYDVPGYSSLKEMMAAIGDQIDVVSILTPSGMHADHCLEIASYGKHVVVEKPMALRLQDADAMIRACDEAKVRLFVVKQNRYNPPVVQVREALQAKRFGKLVLGTVRVRWCRTQDYYNLDDWRGTWGLDGGVFANQAIHHIDALVWLMGDVESVYAKSGTFLVDIETEDTGVVILKFTSGALGIIEATTAARPKDTEGSLSVLGERGLVEVGGFALNEMKTWNFSDGGSHTNLAAGDLKNLNENPPNVYGFSHARYLAHAVNCIQSGAPALVDGLEGRRSLEVVTAIYESIETQREVHLRFKPTKCRLGER